MHLARRRSAAVVAALAATVSCLSLAAVPSQADDTSVLTVVGTSDVYDSSLVQKVLKPGFEAAYPQYDLHYVSKGTGAAIAYAQAGTADAMIVHAAALENQFVDPSSSGFPAGTPSFSKEPYGRAIFWGDYVLLGPASDPAGVLDNGSTSHDIATAFEKIAAAGEAGTAEFVSRGGTPGTTVAEHAIWKQATNLSAQCAVKSSDGGGTSPSKGGDGSACPTTAAGATKIDYPDWYHVTGLTQGPNVTNANVCNYSGRSNKCYVLTDRGTFNNLQYEDVNFPTAAPGLARNLKVVTRDNTASGARGGIDLLVNSFHAYVVNPDASFAGGAKPTLNTAGATAFLDWMTSASGQAQIGKYLKADPPFIPSASPRISADDVPSSVKEGGSFTVKGSLRNVVPGTPALDDVPVTLQAIKASDPSGVTPTTVATTRTGDDGSFSLPVKPTEDRVYSLTTGSITKIENSSLSPVFGDLLSPATLALGTVTVTGAPNATVTALPVPGAVDAGKTFTATGTVTDPTHSNAALAGAKVTLLASKSGATPVAIASGTTSADGIYAITYKPKRNQAYTVTTDQISTGPNPEDRLAPTTAVVGPVAVTGLTHMTSAKVGKNSITIKGTVSPQVNGRTAHLSLYAELSKDAKKKGLTYRAQVPLKAGQRTFTAPFQFRSGTWTFRVRYVHTGEIDPGYSQTVTKKVG